MKRIKIFPLILVVLLVIPMCLIGCEDTRDQLVIYNWADYIYDFEDEFKEYYLEKTGREVNPIYVTFDTNETMLTRITRGDSNVDVMCPSDYAIQKLLEQDLLVKLDYFTSSDFENSGYIDTDLVAKVADAFSDLSKDMTEYFVPYMYGTLGILYNLEYVEDLGMTQQQFENAGWGVLFNDNLNGGLLNSALTKKIMMKDSIRDSYAATVFYLLESGALNGKKYQNMPISELINCVDDELLALVKDALIEQKEQLYGYEVDFGKDEMIQGNIVVNLAWSGDAMYAIDESDAELAYFVPSIAGNIWFDGWVIPKTAKNVEAAKIFIDFLNSPYVAAQNMAEIMYTSAVSASAIQADEDAMQVLLDCYEFDKSEIADFVTFFFDELHYPNVNDLSLGVMRDFGANNEKVVLMWETVRATGISTLEIVLIVVGALIVIVGVAMLVIWLKNRKQRKVRV